jgi:hypothetical protein
MKVGSTWPTLCTPPVIVTTPARAVLGRYLVGSDSGGYRLGHTRIVEFVAPELFDVLPTYRSRIAEYCSRWRAEELDDHARRYILLHAAHHLADAASYDALFALLDADWMVAKWRSFGSYARLIDDLNVAADLALRRQPCDLARVAAMAVARGTARTIMAEFPAAVMIALVRLGNAAGVMEMMRAERDIESQTRQVESLLQIAGAMLRADSAPSDDFVDTDRVEFALQLLLGALGTALENTNLAQVVPIVSIVSDDRTLPEERKGAFLEQMRRLIVARAVDPAFRCAAIGLLAQAAVRLLTQRELPEALVTVRVKGRALLQMLESVWRGFAHEPTGLWKMGRPAFADLLRLAGYWAVTVTVPLRSSITRLTHLPGSARSSSSSYSACSSSPAP